MLPPPRSCLSRPFATHQPCVHSAAASSPTVQQPRLYHRDAIKHARESWLGHARLLALFCHSLLNQGLFLSPRCARVPPGRDDSGRGARVAEESTRSTGTAPRPSSLSSRPRGHVRFSSSRWLSVTTISRRAVLLAAFGERYCWAALAHVGFVQRQIRSVPLSVRSLGSQWLCWCR